tara:strand:- start:3033 stop:5366 length:2334 start_codon:yes stop_codon:yes gene_type:complete
MQANKKPKTKDERNAIAVLEKLRERGMSVEQILAMLGKNKGLEVPEVREIPNNALHELLFKLFETMPCGDIYKYVNTNKQIWEILNSFPKKNWNTLIDNIDAPEFENWRELPKSYIRIRDNDSFGRFGYNISDVLFEGHLCRISTSDMSEYVYLPYSLDTRVKEINGARITMELLDYNIGDTYVGKFGKEVKITHIYRKNMDTKKYFEIVYSFFKKKITLPEEEFNSNFFSVEGELIKGSRYGEINTNAEVIISNVISRYDETSVIKREVEFKYDSSDQTLRFPLRRFGAKFKPIAKKTIEELMKQTNNLKEKQKLLVTELNNWISNNVNSIDTLTKEQNKAYTKKSDEIKALKAKLEEAHAEIKRLRDRPRFSIVIPASEIIITNRVDRVYKGYTRLYMRPDLGFLRGIEEAKRSTAARWAVKCIYNAKVHKRTRLNRLDAVVLKSLRKEWIQSFSKTFNSDSGEKKRLHLIQEKKPPGWMNIFFNTKKIYSDDDIEFYKLTISQIQIEKVDLPYITDIGNNVFEKSKVTELNLPAVEKIGDDVLTVAKLKTLELPEVKEIGANFLNKGSIGFMNAEGRTNVYDIHWPKIRKLGRGFLGESKSGVVPLPYEFLFENPDAYFYGIGGKPVQWVDKTRKEVVCIQLKWVFASESSLNLHVNVLNRYHQPISIVKAIKKTILDYLSKGHKVYTDRRDPEVITRKDRLSYFKQQLNISVKGKIDREEFGEDMCELIGKDGACKLESNTRNTWNAVMVYKGSGGSSSDNNTVTGMMMSLKF